MATVIIFDTFDGDVMALIREYVWECEDSDLKRKLDLLLNPLGPITSDPDPDYNIALTAVKLFGGRITYHESPEFEPGTVY